MSADNTANNVSNFGGDPVTQLIVIVYQMIKNDSLVTQQIQPSAHYLIDLTSLSTALV